MTAPDLSSLIPSKAKTYVALVGSLLSFAVPYVLQMEQYLPSPWPAVIGVVLFILSALGVYHAPYTPPGAVLVPDKPNINITVDPAGGGGGNNGGYISPSVRPADGTYRNPWA